MTTTRPDGAPPLDLDADAAHSPLGTGPAAGDRSGAGEADHHRSGIGVDELVSVDGRTFVSRTSFADAYLAGDLTILECPGGRRLLAQVLGLELAAAGVRCTGRVVAEVDDGSVRESQPRPFGGGRMSRVPIEVLEAFDVWSHQDLVIGTQRSDDGAAPAAVRTGGFNRHTFVCGQSGSGKTYALGVLLERLLAHTGLDLIVLDPNADFVRLGDVLPEAVGESAETLRRTPVRVLRSGHAAREPGVTPLTVAFPELSPAHRAAVLGVDPLKDREEYNALHDLLSASLARDELMDFADRLAASDRPIDRTLAQRFENLGLLEMSVWSRRDASCLSETRGAARALVLEMAGFDDPRERSIAALALLDHLWAQREERSPVLLVIDEAHNLCSAEPADPLQAAVTERLVQIAGEGRKYGLWLLLSTQRPAKIHPNVLSQCDNVLLMRMNSPGDLAEIGSVFGFVPPSLLSAVPELRRGECLVAGAYSALPRMVHIGARLTRQGGSDVDVPRAPARAAAPTPAWPGPAVP